MNAQSGMTPEMNLVKTRMKATWESGDYGIFAKHLEAGALEFFNRLNLAPGTRLLDIACGAGQLTIPAARKGLHVTALDLAENLVKQAQTRAKAEGLSVRVEQGDAESLPFEDETFDVAMSLIGAMFAPRPELVASEMVRVCRRGGRVIMGNWTAEGFVGKLFKTISKHVPPPPQIPSPLQWGNEDVCRQRFGDKVSDLKITRRLYPLQYPFGPAEVVDFFNKYYGPTFRAYESLNSESKTAYCEELTALWSRENTKTDGTTLVLAEYAEVIGVK